MIFTLFTAIVLIAEVIIAFTIIFHLIKLDKYFIEASEFIAAAKPKIKDISGLAKGISEQMAELVPIWIDNLKDLRNKIILAKLESLMSAFLFWSINIKVMRKFKQSKLLKAAFKGLSLLQNVI